MTKVLLVAGLVISSAWAKTSDAAKGRNRTLVDQLDLLVYHANLVHTHEAWIERFAPESEKQMRLKIFKPILKKQFPALLRQDDRIFFFNSESQKLESVEALRIVGWDHYFLNGKDVTRFPGEKMERWLERTFDLKTESATARYRYMGFMIPEARAISRLGAFIAAAVIFGAHDTQEKYHDVYIPPRLRDLPSGELDELERRISRSLKSELDKRIPNLEEIRLAKERMRTMVLRQMREASELKCVVDKKRKYPGAQFELSVDGRRLKFLSQPQDEGPMLNLILSDAGGGESKSELFFNQASNSYSVRSTMADGQFSVKTGTQGSNGVGLFESVVAPFVKDERISRKSSRVSEENRRAIADWLNVNAADSVGYYQMCNRITRENKRSHDQPRYGEYVNRRTSVPSESIFRDIKEACKTLDLINGAENKYGNQPYAFNPWGDQWEKNTKLAETIGKNKKALEGVPEAVRLYLSRSNCDLIGHAKLEGSELFDILSPPDEGRYRVFNPKCAVPLLESLANQKPEVYQGVQTQLDEARKNNQEADKRDSAYAVQVADFEKALSLSEAATGCCRLTECREAMDAEAKVMSTEAPVKGIK